MTEGTAGRDESRACPRCGTALTNVGAFWICPTHGEVADVRGPSHLRIFLSYGHDANAPPVERIKADLEARGHEVWSDQTKVRSGDDWRRRITEGILHSGRVLSVNAGPTG